MGNHHSGSHTSHKPRKNVHWKSAGRPAVPGKPEIIPLISDEEPNAITLRWLPPVHDGGAPLQGYQVECNRLGTPAWVRTAPAVVQRPELVLTGLEPPHRYQFRVAAINAVGRSDHSDLSDVLTVNSERANQEPPSFTEHLSDVTALENDKTEFRIGFTGSPTPTVSWFKDGYEIFSSRRTAIMTDENHSVLVFHQTLASDEGEIKCTATNRAGHAVSKAHLFLEAAPKLRYPRQYEDGLLYEINETVFLKTTIVGKPSPSIEWRHDGHIVQEDRRIQITNTPKFSILKIHSAQRSDRGEYQIYAKNIIGEDSAAFLVTITAPPEPPRRILVTRQVDKSVTLTWDPPEDDGGCRIGNYVVEYYRTGWNVWLKATTSRKTSITLFELIEGSEYRFRVKAESPYGMSAPSSESTPVKIPGRAIDMEFLAVESRIITDVLLREDGEEAPVSPVPRRRRLQQPRSGDGTQPDPAPTLQPKQRARSNEFMLLLCPNVETNEMEKAEKRKSFQLDLEDALSPPQISLSAPDLSSRCTLPLKYLRNAVSSTELLHERAMARFYKAVAMTEEQEAMKQKRKEKAHQNEDTSYKDIPLYNTNSDTKYHTIDLDEDKSPRITIHPPDIITENNLITKEKVSINQNSIGFKTTENKWQNASFEEDYTASTVSTEGEYSDEGSLNGDLERKSFGMLEDDTYNPRDKYVRSSPDKVKTDLESDKFKPVLDPNFVPKPILKKREAESIQPTKIILHEEKIEKKGKKMAILKKITKMPVQNPFSLSKKPTKKEVKPEVIVDKNVSETSAAIKQEEDFLDEGKTVIDYYSNIVKEYGSQKKHTALLYLNTDDLKNEAEKQEKQVENYTGHVKDAKSKGTEKTKEYKTAKRNKSKRSPVPKIIVKKEKPNDTNSSVKQDSSSQSAEKCTQKIVLRKTERATIVIPIDYQQLEENAKVTVRSAIDYMVDLCLLLLAFWAYFFKDERLAIPFLVLIIYRQLQETIFLNIPQWYRRHTPNWLKKTS